MKKPWKSSDDKIFVFIISGMAVLIALITGVGISLRNSREQALLAVAEVIEETSVTNMQDKVEWEYDGAEEMTEITSVSTADYETAASGVEYPININTASASELMALSGVGEVTARAIIDYREKKKFETIEEIMGVKGIGEKKFEKFKHLICV